MRRITLHLDCAQHPADEPPVTLGTWWIESHYQRFDPAQVNEGLNHAVDTQVVPDGSGRLRYRMTCPQCGATPTFTAELIDRALEAIYEKDAYDKVVHYRI